MHGLVRAIGGTPSLIARRFVERPPDATRDEIAGALLHDVRKITAGLGTVGGVFAPRGTDLRGSDEV
jgi:hypothetical protein